MDRLEKEHININTLTYQYFIDRAFELFARQLYGYVPAWLNHFHIDYMIFARDGMGSSSVQALSFPAVFFIDSFCRRTGSFLFALYY
jgi:hypothetical protein